MKKGLGCFLLMMLLALTAAAAGEAYPESKHPYDHDTDQSWTYTHPGPADYLKLTFSSDSQTEPNYDVLYITDSEGSVSGYSGPMANRTVYVKGSSFTVRLTSDSSYSLYGFRFAGIEATTEAECRKPQFTVSNGEITGFAGVVSELVIPNEVAGETVTSIGDGVFQGNGSITSVTIPTGIQTIGHAAFSGCTALKTVEFASDSKLKTLGDSAFEGCTALTRIQIPSYATAIGQSAFSGCTGLKSVSFGFWSTLNSMGSFAFQNCAALTEIEIPAAVTEIGLSTFSGCTSLENVDLTSRGDLTVLGDGAFFNCTALRSISVPASVTSIGNNAFSNCTSLGKVSIASGSALNHVGSWAFHNCSALKEISLPHGVTVVGDSTFYQCSALTKATFLASQGVAVHDWAFAGCTGLQTVSGIVSSLEEFSFYGCAGLKSLTLGDTMESFSRENRLGANTVLMVGIHCNALEEVIASGRTYTVRETKETNAVDSAIETVAEKADAIIAARISEGMSDYQKALALHNWLIFNAQYDYTGANDTAEGVLLRGTGVGQSYALAYQLLLNRAGISNRIEYSADSVWNMIKLDGAWYYVSCALDDPGEGGEECWDYFCLKDIAPAGA